MTQGRLQKFLRLQSASWNHYSKISFHAAANSDQITTPLKDFQYFFGLPWWLRQKRICLQCGRSGFDPWVGKVPWKMAWQPSPVCLPGESPWTEEPGGLQSMGIESRTWATKHRTATLWENVQGHHHHYDYNSLEKYIHVYLCKRYKLFRNKFYKEDVGCMSSYITMRMKIRSEYIDKVFTK